MRILLLDSDDSDRSILSKQLKGRGFDVYETTSAEDALLLTKLRLNFDALVMDANPGDLPGVNTIRALRNGRFGRPVIVTDINSTPEGRARFMNAGADTVLDWPINSDELEANIKAFVRRMYGHDSSFLQTGNLCLNIDTREVTVDGDPLHVTKQEYRMLELMSLRKGQCLDNDTFLDHMYYCGEEEPEAKTVDVYICKLRKKLRDAGALDEQGKSLIQTIRGQGFALRDLPTSELQMAMRIAHDACPHSSAPDMKSAATCMHPAASTVENTAIMEATAPITTRS